MEGYLLENGVDKFLLEDGTGVLLMESGAAAGLIGSFLLMEDVGR